MRYKTSINIFTRLHDIYDKLNDTYRSNAYHNAVKYLLNDDLSKIGDGLKKKIEIIERKGYLKELIQLESYEKILDVKGFGLSFIKKLMELNIKINNPKDLLDDKIREKLLENNIRLTHLQLINLNYYNELSKSINRNKVNYITKDLKKYFEKRNIEFKKFEIVGSYRRGNEEVGDIDILLISDSKCDYSKAYLMSKIYNAIVLYKNYINKLIQGVTKFSFLLKHGKDIVQVDIRLFSEKHYPTALFYFTGSSEFNKKIRAYAKKQGYILNEYELKKIDGNPIKVESEKDIFRKLGIEYIPPINRTKSSFRIKTSESFKL